MYRPTLTLTLSNAEPALRAGLRAIAGGQTEIDLAQLTTVDSAAVATLAAWRRAARAAGQPLRFLNFPANLRSLAHLYGVEGLLGIDGDARQDTGLHAASV